MRLPSIRYSGPILFLLPVVAVVIAFSLVASWQGHRLADELAGRVMEQAAARVASTTNGYLRNAALVTDYVAILIAEGELDPQRLRDWRPVLYRQLSANPEINSITFGTPSGEATWMIRYPGELGLEYAISDADTNRQIIEYRVGVNGSVESELGVYAYDPRERPWYRAALAADDQTWSDVYAWVRRSGDVSTLGIAYARPIYDSGGELRGVLDADISLLDVSRFLKEAKTFESAESMLVGRDGNLIGTSADIAVVGVDGGRIASAGADHPLIADAARKVQSFSAVDAPQVFEVNSEGIDYRIDIRPLENSWGLDWRLAVIVPDSEITSGVTRLRRQAWAIGGAIALATLFLGLVASSSMVRPVTRLAAAVRRIGSGEFDEPVNIGGHLEFVQLSGELRRMSAGLKDRMRLRQSLELAMEIQQKLLPGQPPNIAGLDVAGHSTYCDETGGDYYDFIELHETPSHELVVVLGDVMGHGIAAALLMATARGILRSRAGEEGSLGQWLTHVNRLLVKDTGGERFMTMVLLVIDPAKRRVRLANAGHDAPIVYDPAQDQFMDLPESGGLPLGIVEQEEYEDATLERCQPGQILLVGTDGLWESQDGEGAAYGKDRLQEVIRTNAKSSAEEISAAIAADLHNFRGKARQDDDVTFVLIKFMDVG
ncbi:MAG: SpoIIE family protein phosphatase [Pirellulales bacterium]